MSIVPKRDEAADLDREAMNSARASEFDAIVVGSGPNGAIVARALSAGALKVLILEAGGYGSG